MNFVNFQRIRQILSAPTHRWLVLISCFLGLFLLGFPILLFYIKYTKPVVKSIYHKENLTIPPNAHYVPDQLIIKYKDGMSPQDLKEQIAKQSASDQVLHSLSGKKSPQTSLDEIRTLLKSAGVTREENQSDRVPSMKEYYLVKLQKGTNLARAQKMLNDSEYIDFAQANFQFSLQMVPNDPYYPQQWDMQKIQMDQAWDVPETSDATVGVIDSGVDANHPDLAGVVVGGTNYLGGTADISDSMGHGSHVAGTIAALVNNNQGIAGVNKRAKILVEKVCDTSGACGSGYVIGQAIRDATSNNVRVINMSLAGGGANCSQDPNYQAAIDYANSKGVVVVVAAGNGYNDLPPGVDVIDFVPGSCRGVVTVGAVNSSDQRPNFSNWGNLVAIAAPGVNILSTIPANNTISQRAPQCNVSSDSYCAISGTSMAAPHVAGVAALLFSAYPQLTRDQVINCILTGSDPITTDFPLGGRRLNAYKALQACSGQSVVSTPTSTPTPTPTRSILTPTPTPTQTPFNLTCNGHCSADFECGGITNGVCDVVNGCRNSACMSNNTCVCSAPTVTSTPTPTNTPTPTPAVVLATSTPEISPIVAPTPVTLYDCYEVPSSTTVNGQQIQITKLKCVPL